MDNNFDQLAALEVDGEARFPTLRRECPCPRRLWMNRQGGRRDEGDPCSECEENQYQHGKWCENCNGQGWLPLPEAEQMGALVRLARDILGIDYLHWAWIDCDTPEEALSAAILEVANETPGR